MNKTVHKILLCLAAGCLLAMNSMGVMADHSDLTLQTAIEYEKMQEGVWPTEVTFTDTVFTKEYHAPAASKLTEFNGSADSSFELKAGERVSFTMKGSDYRAVSYSDSLISWNKGDSGLINGLGFGEEGVYVFHRDKDSYQLTVTGFGFDHDLSGCGGYAVLTIDIPAMKVMEEADYLAGESGNLYTVCNDFFNEHTNDQITDMVHVRAEGEITLSPVDAAQYSLIIEDPYSWKMTNGSLDAVAFQFIFSEDTVWQTALNDGEYRTINARPLYYTVWEEDPDPDFYSNNGGQEYLHYSTPAIVMADSDLAEREQTVLGEKESKPAQGTETAEPEQSETPAEQPAAPAEQSETKPASSGMSPVIVIGGLAVIAAAGFFLLKKKK